MISHGEDRELDVAWSYVDHRVSRVRGSGFEERVWGLGSGVWGLGSGVWGLKRGIDNRKERRERKEGRRAVGRPGDRTANGRRAQWDAGKICEPRMDTNEREWDKLRGS